MSSGQRTLLGFDFGERRIGVAVGQELTGGAQALKILKTLQGKPDWMAIDGLISEWRPNALVVGLPVHMDGTPQPMTDKARQFGHHLKERYNLPVYFADERLTSAEAASESGIDENIDDQAARIILQSWLNEQRN
jgi:putative Holliday junction resolvase